MTSSDAGGKLRLVFFRTVDPDLPAFIQRHLDEHVRCLSLFFDVRLVSGDCDYDRVCDLYEPDVSLFESGVYSRPHEILHTGTHPEVPKLGFLDADAYCESRKVFISDMAQWNVSTFFTMSVAMAEYTPDIAGNLFVWPNFIDDTVFSDYGQPKTIPVLFTGSQATHYPWRNRVSRVVSAAYPTMTCPHHGWFAREATTRMLHGAAYARLLNSAQVVPTCGTIAHEVVRKHFEIPAAMSCLVTEPTSSVAAAGFVDMENCVLADEHDVLDKLDYLFSQPDELAHITQAGYKMAHARHTASQRDELLQWLTLHRDLGPHERIIQRGPFARLEVVADQPLATNTYVISGGTDRELLDRGRREQQARDYQAAQHLYRRCLNYHPLMPEPILGLTECALVLGRPAEALDWITQSVAQSLDVRHADEPDPVEWAYYIRALLCAGSRQEAARHAAQFPGLQHDELARTRSAVRQACDESVRVPVAAPGERRLSVHVQSEQSPQDWLAGLQAMLDACGQQELSGLLHARQDRFLSALSGDSQTDSPQPPSRQGPVTLRRRRTRWIKRVKDRTRPWRHRHWGPDSFGLLSRQLAQREPVPCAYVLGSSARRGFHKAITGGLAANPSGPELQHLASPQPADLAAPDHALIFVLGEAGFASVQPDVLAQARILVLDGISGPRGQYVHARVAEFSHMELVAFDNLDRGGYAVYRRVAP